MTAFIIIAAVILFILLLLLLPISFSFKLDEDFFVKIKLAGIKVYSIKPENDIKENKEDTESDKKALENKKNMLKTLYKKLGFSGTVKELTDFLKALLKRFKKLLKHMTFKKIKLNIKVATDDAAQTAVEYGKVCTFVYPVLTMFSAVANVKYKKIEIASDFNSEKPEIVFSGEISCKVIFLIIAAFGFFSEYNKFKVRNEL